MGILGWFDKKAKEETEKALKERAEDKKERPPKEDKKDGKKK